MNIIELKISVPDATLEVSGIKEAFMNRICKYFIESIVKSSLHVFDLLFGLNCLDIIICPK